MDKGLHTLTYGRIGVTLFETRTNPPIRYAFAAFREDQGYYIDYVVAKDGDIFRLYRHFNRCQKETNIKEN